MLCDQIKTNFVQPVLFNFVYFIPPETDKNNQNKLTLKGAFKWDYQQLWQPRTGYGNKTAVFDILKFAVSLWMEAAQVKGLY